MIPVPPAEPPEINAFTTITRLIFSQAQNKQVSSTHKQPIHSNIPLVNQNTNSSHQSQNVHPHVTSTVIVHQFSMITQELWNFMDKVSGDINKITHVFTTVQENAGKLIENAISQSLTKPQDIIPTNTSRDTRNFGVNRESNSLYDVNWTVSWQTNNNDIPQNCNNEAYHF